MEEDPANAWGPWLVSANSHEGLVNRQTLALSSAKVLFPRGGFAVQAAACPWITQASMLWLPGLLGTPVGPRRINSGRS